MLNHPSQSPQFIVPALFAATQIAVPGGFFGTKGQGLRLPMAHAYSYRLCHGSSLIVGDDDGLRLRPYHWMTARPRHGVNCNYYDSHEPPVEAKTYKRRSPSLPSKPSDVGRRRDHVGRDTYIATDSSSVPDTFLFFYSFGSFYFYKHTF